ncbi:hypothetical protein R3P38DRAFT_3172544 [Favolaschia claudopus]|uniref:Aberrant panicle organization 1 protein n=1 Tax=Favolaschia claudopus TaxID=2862362 RepID=A0AAW0DM95_9AGAR
MSRAPHSFIGWNAFAMLSSESVLEIWGLSKSVREGRTHLLGGASNAPTSTFLALPRLTHESHQRAQFQYRHNVIRAPLNFLSAFPLASPLGLRRRLTPIAPVGLITFEADADPTSLLPNTTKLKLLPFHHHLPHSPSQKFPSNPSKLFSSLYRRRRYVDTTYQRFGRRQANDRPRRMKQRVPHPPRQRSGGAAVTAAPRSGAIASRRRIAVPRAGLLQVLAAGRLTPAPDVYSSGWRTLPWSSPPSLAPPRRVAARITLNIRIFFSRAGPQVLAAGRLIPPPTCQAARS